MSRLQSKLPSLALFMFVLALLPVCLQAGVTPADTAAKIALGKLLFHDSNLSEPAGQSCASCHSAELAHADRDKIVSPGADASLFGNRNAPSIHYVKYNPELFWNAEDETWMGGFFFDGRARTLREQATGPLLNPLEMGNKNSYQIRDKLRGADYAGLIRKLYGDTVLEDPDAVLAAVADAIVAYERGPEFALFSSKYDYYLQGKLALSEQERRGLELFEAEDKGNCAACHPSAVGDAGQPPLFTDFSYDNLGAGINPKLPFLKAMSE